MLSSDRSNDVGTSAGEDPRPTSRVDAPASPDGPFPEEVRPVVRRRRPPPPAPRWPGRLAVVMAVLACAWVTMGALSGAWTLMSVPTGSMEPNIPKGSMIVVRQVPVDDVGVGDVIVFHAPETGVLTVHRIVGGERRRRDPRGGDQGRRQRGARPVGGPPGRLPRPPRRVRGAGPGDGDHLAQRLLAAPGPDRPVAGAGPVRRPPHHLGHPPTGRRRHDRPDGSGGRHGPVRSARSGSGSGPGCPWSWCSWPAHSPR